MSVELIQDSPKNFRPGVKLFNVAEKILPIIKNTTSSIVDFRFLQGDQLRGTDYTPSMRKLLRNLGKPRSEFSVNIIVGPSGIGKTKTLFDLSRNRFTIYLECFSDREESRQLDVCLLSKFLPKKKDLGSDYYWCLTRVNKLVTYLIYSRIVYLAHLIQSGILQKNDYEKWLLAQTEDYEHITGIQDLYNQFICNDFPKPSTWSKEMKKYFDIIGVESIPICIDEAHRLFNSFEGAFKSKNSQNIDTKVCFSRPFISNLMFSKLEIRCPIVMAGTKLRLKQMENALDSVIAKLGSNERPVWHVVYITEITKSDKEIKDFMKKFIVWKSEYKYFTQMKGRLRFPLGLIQKLYGTILNGNDLTKERILNIFNKWHDDTVLAEKNGSLFNHLLKIHNCEYKAIYLSDKLLINIPDIIKKLTLFGLTYPNFHYFELDDSDTLDLINLGVCLVEKNKKSKKYSISEPWALEASVYLFNKFKIDLTLNTIQCNLSELSNNSTDSVKGKYLELLVASSLIHYKNKVLQEIPIFKKALQHKDAPEWFKNLSDNMLTFERYQYDTSGVQMNLIMEKKDTTTIIIPPKLARADLFCLMGNTIVIGGMKFYTKTIPNEKLRDNKLTTNVNNQWKSKEGKTSKKGKKRANRIAFAIQYNKFKSVNSNVGTIRLLVTFPNCLDEENPITFATEKERTDVVIEISKSNMNEFFDKDSCNIISNFYPK